MNYALFINPFIDRLLPVNTRNNKEKQNAKRDGPGIFGVHIFLSSTDTA